MFSGILPIRVRAAGRSNSGVGVGFATHTAGALSWVSFVLGFVALALKEVRSDQGMTSTFDCPGGIIIIIMIMK